MESRYLSNQGVNSVYFLTMNVKGDGKDVWPWISKNEFTVVFSLPLPPNPYFNNLHTTNVYPTVCGGKDRRVWSIRCALPIAHAL